MAYVDGRDDLFCESCNTFHFLAESADGVPSTDAPTEYSCPVCGKGLVRA
jgi:hypothetical protein